MTEKGEAEAFIYQVVERHERVAAVVFAAGRNHHALIARPDPEAEEILWKVHVRALREAITAILRHMIPAREGAIVAVSSMAALHPECGQSAYASVKAAQEALIRTVALEVAAKGIRANAVAPGFIDSPMVRELGEAKVRELVAEIPLGKLGHPQQVADAITFLLSPKSAYLTGQVLRVDGGASI